MSGAETSPAFASVDIGTNSTRVLIARTDGIHTRTLERRMEITRLGEGVDATGAISDKAIERTLETLSFYHERIDEFSCESVVAAATSAIRDSRNSKYFLNMAERILGTHIKELSGEEEAWLSFIGASSDLEREGGVFVFDIGGGSTELAFGVPGIEGSRSSNEFLSASVDVGCVRMSERFLVGDPPSPVAIGRMESHILLTLKPVIEDFNMRDIQLGVGLAGTVTTISGISLGLKEYDSERIHHSTLGRDTVREIFEKLASVSSGERRRLMKVEPGRADVIVGGAAVLCVLMDLAKLDEIMVSEKDILDGMILEAYREAAL
ncbi:MAG: Ppx/GppA phosphatase family protein [Actinomycetota bacterium]|nr:Ppx/GppA phosphatase family protein [Actinomycetota bacterium]